MAAGELTVSAPPRQPRSRMNVDELQQLIRRFVADRQWQRFHTPKNLVMALSGEVGELIEHFQWLEPAASQAVMSDASTAEAIRDELADVLVYVLRLADVLDVDLEQAVHDKMAKNAAKYPADRVRGRAIKYSKLED